MTTYVMRFVETEGNRGLMRWWCAIEGRSGKVESVSGRTDTGAVAEGVTNEVSQTWKIPLAGRRIRDDP